MASRPALSTATRGKIYMGSEIRDSLSLLDVIFANQFKGEFIAPEVVEQTEENFYRGAPPTWLNFFISEQAEFNGTETSVTKRDGYDMLVQQIRKRRSNPGTSTIKLFHQQGCGGTTLAMQVLWHLRKTFRCAVLTGSTLDIKNIAKEVVFLFTAGDQDHHNTVLLLLHNDFNLDNLQDSIMEEVAEQEIDTDMPVVIILNCVRASDQVILKKELSKDEKRGFKRSEKKYVILKKELSDTEKQKFCEKKEELSRRYDDRCKQFHGLNIMQSNFSQDYICEACEVLKTFKKTSRRNRKIQLVAFLSLLNTYVPGSYLLESPCLDFLNYEDSMHVDLSLEDRMKPFSHLIITFQEDMRSEKKVRMAHPMIAQHCTQVLAEAGVTRSDTARNFLTYFCRNEVPPSLLGFIKDMLTKREMKEEEKTNNDRRPERGEEDQEKFSKLILHIEETEDKKQSASILKVASNTFCQNALFPQALARFYYLELNDYKQAEVWAKAAKDREPKKSFIADTLGQVHKNHLRKKGSTATPREILQLATYAIEAFKDEEQLAENEHVVDEHSKAKVLRAFNSRGKFGYLQVCNLVYDLLVCQNETWKKVLTKSVSMGSVLKLLGDDKLLRFKDLVSSLRDEVEKKSEFFFTFLTYSESVMKKDEASYISRETAECYKKYVGDSAPKNQEKSDETIQNLKQKLAATPAGVLSSLELWRNCAVSELKKIATWWKEICLSNDSTRHDLANYILAIIMLINKNESLASSDYQNAFRQKMPLSLTDEPELHLLALLICWPRDDEEKCVSDLNQLIQHLQHSYEHEFKTLFHLRYLRPLFFIGKGHGLSRYVHKRIVELLWIPDVLRDPKTDWRNESIFRDPEVQEHLLRVKGVVRNYRLYATFGGTEIKLDVNQRDGLWKSGQVSFYLGFTIRGPVAFSIQPSTAAEGPLGKLELGACGDVMDPKSWTKLEPEVKKVYENETFSLQSEAGHYECSVSRLRWVCKEQVSLSYQFCSWEEYMSKPSCMDYMPAGPLLDITVTAGEVEEVFLPHWIDLHSTESDMFAVLHVDSCGEFVEKASEVTSSHIKLHQPTFSPRGAMIRMKLGLPVKVYYDVLIYKTKKEFLTMHVYLVPPDRDIQQTVERKETSYGSIIIPKPNPDKSLQMMDHFILTTDMGAAEILPNKLKLRYERRNYFEVFIRNAESDFCLKLQSEQKKTCKEDTVWICTIRKGDYQPQSTDHEQDSDRHFVVRNRKALINRVSNTVAILDELVDLGFISNESYDAVRALKTTQDQMRDILKFVISAGTKGKDALYEILKKMKSMSALICELEQLSG